MAATYLLHIDAVTGAAKYQTSLHRFGKSLGLQYVSCCGKIYEYRKIPE
jgi:hypothetical protein